ncbi:hypothetical protein PVAP13_1NG238300 [Panicum virgatum]|uniref:Cathepsin propeptide inhibitor domain-containing protein n=1 Tax=Panicum virgatum TaxID=38727 RepID=A0A8T0WX09_PANVG|nr:hypothetical protein PVAP13_1NG238300 [Panicum virgatum]
MAHRVLLLLSLAAAAAVVTAAVDAEDPLIRQVVPGGDDNDLELNAESHFLSFVQRFGKSYKDADEHAYRLSVFKSNLRRARRHQLLDPSAEHGITKFSDLTPAEFRRTYLGLRKSRRALLRELGGSAHEAPVLPTDGLPEDFDWRDHGAVGPVKNQSMFYNFARSSPVAGCKARGRGMGPAALQCVDACSSNRVARGAFSPTAAGAVHAGRAGRSARRERWRVRTTSPPASWRCSPSSSLSTATMSVIHQNLIHVMRDAMVG